MTRSVFCACGAQWHAPTVDNPQARSIIEKHHTEAGRPGPWVHCARLDHDQFVEQFGGRCACRACTVQHMAAWRRKRRGARL